MSTISSKTFCWTSWWIAINMMHDATRFVVVSEAVICIVNRWVRISSSENFSSWFMSRSTIKLIGILGRSRSFLCFAMLSFSSTFKRDFFCRRRASSISLVDWENWVRNCRVFYTLDPLTSFPYCSKNSKASLSRLKLKDFLIIMERFMTE